MQEKHIFLREIHIAASTERFPDDRAALDKSVAALGPGAQHWVALNIAERRRLLAELRKNVARMANTWVDAAVRAKKIDSDSPLANEEWMSGPWAMLYGLNRLDETLASIERGTYPDLPAARLRMRPDRQLVVNVFPRTLIDRLVMNGIRAEVWMQPGVTADNLADHMGGFYSEESPTPKVALVLGAGNISSIGPLDVIYKLYAEGQVCILKMNPVNDYLGPVFESIFSPFTDADYLRFAYGGAETGKYLVAHPGIDEIHITGSAKTHDAIVFGSGADGEERKRRDQPILSKRITSELGNVSPTIILPGPWTKADIRFQAEHVATQKFHNGGFNCIASQVLVLPEVWDQATEFMDALWQVSNEIDPRHPYYPGAGRRQTDAVTAHPQAEVIDEGMRAARTLISNIDPNDDDAFAFREEFFAGVLAQTSLPGANAAEFLARAVRFCNERLHGTLGANVIVHPQTMRELGTDLEDAISELRYGAIGINIWQGAGYLLAQTSWGAYPGHTYNDIQSGIGVVHNAMLFDRPEKSVVYGHFRPFPRALMHGQLHMFPKPPWFVTHRRAHEIAMRLVKMESKPSLWHLPGIFWHALRG